MIYIKAKLFAAVLIVSILLLNLSGCSYSFTGASIPAHLHTISIPVCQDRSGSGEAYLVDLFSTELVQKFVDDNSLRVVEKLNADALLECTITSITDAPSVVQGEEASLRKINVTVKVLYRDLVKKKTILDKNFTDYGEYNTEGNISDERKVAITDAVDKITEDILLSVVSNW